MSMEVINGFVCNNCTDVENAKKFIDPAHPDAGPVNQTPKDAPAPRGPAVVLGGALTGQDPGASKRERDAALFQPYGPGARS